jgi:anti-sigma factor RsiW
VRRRLASFCDGELALADQISVEGHLRLCPSCADEAGQYRSLGDALREGAMLLAGRQPEDLAGLQSGVLSRLHAENDQSLSARISYLFEDFHLVWTALGATAAAAACVAIVIGIFYFGPKDERPDSLAAMMASVAPLPAAVGTTGSGERQLLAARPLPLDAMSTVVISSEEDAVLTLAAVVTREGRIAKLAGSDRDAVLELMDRLSTARFEPPRADGGPVAVKMVWLVAYTVVRGKPTIQKPVTISERGTLPSLRA